MDKIWNRPLFQAQPLCYSDRQSFRSGVTLALYSDPQSGSLLWYDSSQPAHPRLHQTHLSPLLETGPMPRSPRPLIHSLRAIKSSAEVALMQVAGHITAQVGVLIPPWCQGHYRFFPRTAPMSENSAYKRLFSQFFKKNTSLKILALKSIFHFFLNPCFLGF